MKIMMVAVTSSAEMSGVQRHAFNAVRCLQLRPEISAIHLVVASWQRKLVQSAEFGDEPRIKIHLAEMDRSARGRNLWHYRELPRLAAESGVDLVHLSYPVPLPAHKYPCPVVVTLHDLYPYEIPSNFGWRQVFFNRIILKQCLRNANAIACVSEITRRRLGERMPSVLRASVRIYNCVEPASGNLLRPPISDLEQDPFLLCVAQHRRNKNIPLMLETFQHLLRGRQIDQAMRLIIVGIPGPETQRIRRTIARFGLHHRIHLLDGISEAELQWCYRHCELLVAPSSTEGFGLPVAEALLAGCRVVCSDIPAFREVSRDACRFVAASSHPVSSFASAIVNALTQPRPRALLLQQFSRVVLAPQYARLYHDLLLISETPQHVRAAAQLNAATPERQA